jgi:hypothetical protein
MHKIIRIFSGHLILNVDKDDKIRAHKASIFLSKEANFSLPCGVCYEMYYKFASFSHWLRYIVRIISFFIKLSLILFRFRMCHSLSRVCQTSRLPSGLLLETLFCQGKYNIT